MKLDHILNISWRDVLQICREDVDSEYYTPTSQESYVLFHKTIKVSVRIRKAL